MPDPPDRHAQSRRTPIGRDDATRVHGRQQRAPCPNHHRAVQAPRALRDDGVPPHGEAHPRSGRTARKRAQVPRRAVLPDRERVLRQPHGELSPRFQESPRRCWATGNAGSTSSSSASDSICTARCDDSPPTIPCAKRRSGTTCCSTRGWTPVARSSASSPTGRRARRIRPSPERSSSMSMRTRPETIAARTDDRPGSGSGST